MTFEQFEDEMDRLGGLRFRPADLRTHWEALRDLPLEMLKAGITRAQRTRAEFPTPVELRQDIDAVSHQVRSTEPLEDRGSDLEQPVTFPLPTGSTLRISREWRYYCEVCSDAGMRSFWCGDPKAPQRKPWMPTDACERNREHGSHEWVRRCECHDSNPAVQRRIEQMAKYAASGAQKKASA